MNIKISDIVKIKGEEGEWAVIHVKKIWSKSDQAHVIDRIEVFNPEMEDPHTGIPDPNWDSLDIGLDQIESVRERPTLNVGDYVYYDGGLEAPPETTFEDYVRNGVEGIDGWETPDQFTGSMGIIRQLLDTGECRVECTVSHAYGDDNLFVVTSDQDVFAVSRSHSVTEKKSNQKRAQEERRPLNLRALAILVGVPSAAVLLIYLIDFL
jgi:hypothetical protein